MSLFKDTAVDYAKRNKMTRNNEVSPVLTHALTVMVTNILEREDSIKQDYEEKLNETKNHYEAELSKCKNEISELKAEQRTFLWGSPFRIPRHLESCLLRLRTLASCLVRLKTLALLCD